MPTSTSPTLASATSHHHDVVKGQTPGYTPPSYTPSYAPSYQPTGGYQGPPPPQSGGGYQPYGGPPPGAPAPVNASQEPPKGPLGGGLGNTVSWFVATRSWYTSKYNRLVGSFCCRRRWVWCRYAFISSITPSLLITILCRFCCWQWNHQCHLLEDSTPGPECDLRQIYQPHYISTISQHLFNHERSTWHSHDHFQ